MAEDSTQMCTKLKSLFSRLFLTASSTWKSNTVWLSCFYKLPSRSTQILPSLFTSMFAAKPSASTPFVSANLSHVTNLSTCSKSMLLISEPPETVRLPRSDTPPAMITCVLLYFLYNVCVGLRVFLSPHQGVKESTPDVDFYCINCQCQLTLHQHLTCKPTNGRRDVRLCTASKKRGSHAAATSVQPLNRLTSLSTQDEKTTLIYYFS